MANLTPGQQAGSGDVSGTRQTGAFSGTHDTGVDPTVEPGQYPGSLFGVALPAGTGAGGSAGASGAADPVNEPGQLHEGISGLGPSDTADTGAPGGSGQMNGGTGGTAISYTRPGAFLTGTNIQDTITDNVSGTSDWTQAIDGSYGDSANQIPGVAGNMPLAGSGPYQPGSGNILKGGYRRGQR